ncbi:hypothetical protein QBC39DRAFT_176330 [Podospora conica]|nr:hypothetical protein QBC39DRAFT_176330 [Schizothecium conicum]
MELTVTVLTTRFVSPGPLGQRGIPVVPKSVQQQHVEQNLAIKQLPTNYMSPWMGCCEYRQADEVLGPSKHLGFVIFDEEDDQLIGNSAPWD